MDKIDFYTDGACSNNGRPDSIGGYSIVFYNNKNKLVIKYSYQENTTNNRMELVPILHIMEKIFKYGNKKTQYTIFSDSAYIVDTINGRWPYLWKASGWKAGQIKNIDLWKKYIELDFKIKVQKKKLKIKKVKGHSGIELNEVCDKYAKLAIIKRESNL